jgi:hypothetical protein
MDTASIAKDSIRLRARTRELVGYSDVEKMRAKFDKEKLDEKYWEEFSVLNPQDVVKKAHQLFSRAAILERQLKELERIAGRFSLLGTVFSPKYSRLREIALEREERYGRLVNGTRIIFMVAENKEIDISEAYFY